jgi:hypothetical protein
MSGRHKKNNLSGHNKANKQKKARMYAAVVEEKNELATVCAGLQQATTALDDQLAQQKAELETALAAAEAVRAELTAAQAQVAEQRAALKARPPAASKQWGGDVGSSRRCQQRGDLTRWFSGYFESEEVFKDRIAEVVANDADIRERVGKQPWVQKETSVRAQKVLDELQEHYDHIGLAVKHIVGISWGKYLTLRRVMSYEFEDPEDLTYGTTGDIGEYVRLEMVTLEGAKLPVLPSYYMLRKEEDDIVANSGGYKLSRDGKAGFRDLMPLLKGACQKEKVKLMVQAEGDGQLVVQLFGDGFNMFRCGKYVNMCLRVCGAHDLEGSALSCDTLSVWAGGDTYDDVASRCADLLDDIAKLLADNKQVNAGWGCVPCQTIGGGDALWINDIMGLSGFAVKHKCNYCEQSSDDFGDLTRPGVKRTYVRACHAAHMPASEHDFPFDCPHCEERVDGEQVPMRFTKARWEAHHRISRSDTWLKTHAREHAAQKWSKPPLFRGMDHCWHPECVLHLLIAIAGTMYKHAVMINVKEKDVALAMNNFLHGVLHIYIRPVKVVKNTEAQDIIKKPSFVGSEAKNAIEHLEDLLIIVNEGAPLTEVQHSQIAARDQFFKVYNRISTRLKNLQKTQQSGH